ncbi:MAG: hypothetical protein R3B13_40750 [Polyangiaceae bacterium]
MRRRGGLSALFLLAAGACTAAPPSSPSTSGASVKRCHYDVQVASSNPLLLDVTADCVADGALKFVASEPPALPHLSDMFDGTGRALAVEGGGITVAASDDATSTLRYRVNLDGVAQQAESFDVALRSGKSVVAPASTWLLRPEPHTARTEVTVDVHPGADMSFATGLMRRDGHYRLGAHEVPVATYSVFGPRAERQLFVPGPAGTGQAEIAVAFADGALDVDVDVVTSWIARSAAAVGEFWGGFPVSRALVVVVPAPGRRGVGFGKVLPESSPGIVLVIGEHSDAAALSADWVLVHELFHLGFPSFQGEGKWLDEGLATYYEPIIRARAGNKSEADVWEEFVRAMPQGYTALRTQGLEHTAAYRGIYWGGAVVSLLADLEARKQSDGARGLEHGLRAILRAGGNASEVWSLEQSIHTCDTALAAPVLAPLAERYAYRGSAVDLRPLWRQLGIEPVTGGVRLRDDAPMSKLRKAIVYGHP